MKALVFLTFAVISAPAPTLAGPSEAEVRGAIARGVAHLREAQTPQGLWRYRYNADHSLGITALAGLALLENGVGADDPAIGRAAEVVRLLAKRSDQTYDLALAILFLARRQAGATGPDDPLIRRLGARLAGGGPGGLWDYGVPLEPVEGEGKATRRRGKARATTPTPSSPCSASGPPADTGWRSTGRSPRSTPISGAARPTTATGATCPTRAAARP